MLRNHVHSRLSPGVGVGGSRPAYQISRLHTHPSVKTTQKPEPGGDGGSQWEPWAEPLRNVVRTQKDFTRPLRSFSNAAAELQGAGPCDASQGRVPLPQKGTPFSTNLLPHGTGQGNLQVKENVTAHTPKV